MDEHIWHHTPRPGKGPKELTEMVDLTGQRGANGQVRAHARLLDLVPGRSGPAYAGWLSSRGPTFTGGVKVATLDPFRGYSNAIRDELEDAVAVLDASHVVKLGLQAMEDTRRRVQQEQLGHRGRKHDPFYKIRGALRAGAGKLTTRQLQRINTGLAVGDPDWEVTVAWWSYQQLRSAFAAADLAAGKRPTVSRSRRRWPSGWSSPTGGSPCTTSAPEPPAPRCRQMSTIFPPAWPNRWPGYLLRCGSLRTPSTTTPRRQTPAGWGIAEPASQRWQHHQLTELCRSRTPEPTWLVVVGDDPDLPAVATVEVTPTATGIAERVRLTVGSAAPDTAAIDRLAAHIADVHPVRTMLVSLHLGGRSGLIGSRFAGHPMPYGLLVGPEGVSEVGLARAIRAGAGRRHPGPTGKPHRMDPPRR